MTKQAILSRVISEDTRSVVLTHLSEQNNAPHLAESVVLYHIQDQFEETYKSLYRTGQNLLTT